MKQLLYKTIYNQHVNKILRNINKAISPVLFKKIEIRPSGSLKIKANNGKILKIKTNQTNYVTHLIFWNGYLNFEYTAIFIKLIKNIQSFYDVGANIGYYSLLASLENQEIKVVGFEPASGPHHYFKENVRINNFTNIKVEALALSHINGEIEFHEVNNKKYKYIEHNLAGESNAGSKTEGLNFNIKAVKTTTLDNYVEMISESKIDLIKLDTEGTEDLILANSDRILRLMKPIIICETLYNRIESKLEKIMKCYDYEFFNHTGTGLKKVKSIIRKEDDGVRNCFFVHPEKYYLIEEFVI
ncbi:MAG: FkbM family methyltransferase [Mariniphaga sp.]|nr:FkbM family methyltransferase [Mariniphaga sp.]